MDLNPGDGSISARDRLLADVLFKVVPKLRDWIFCTKLFNVIMEGLDMPIIIEGYDLELQETTMLQLKGIKVTIPEELPQELLYEFYKHSPYFNLDTLTRVGREVAEKINRMLEENQQAKLN